MAQTESPASPVTSRQPTGRRAAVLNTVATKVSTALVAAYFLSMPVLLAAAASLDVDFLNYGPLGWSPALVYGLAAPLVGYLFARRSPRARFTAYVFLTMDIMRSLARGNPVSLAMDAGLLLFLQTPWMRAAYPSLSRSAMTGRLRSRARAVSAPFRVLRRGLGGVSPQAPAKYSPSLVSWNLTSACNLRCAHCYISAGHRRGQELTTEECHSAVDQMAALGTEMLVLTGGEPLLRTDMLDISRYASQKGIMTVMGTNGVLVDDPMAAALKQSGLQGVGISLDSLHAGKHDSFRGVEGCWHKAVNAFGACLRQGLPVVVQTTATTWNYDEIPALIDFAHDKGATAFNLYYLVCTGRGEELTDITPQQYEDSLAYLAGSQTKYPGMMLRAKCAPHGNRIALQRGSPVAGGVGCPAGTSYMRIAPQGQVTPCPYLPVECGNIRETSLKQIWESSAALAQLRGPELQGRCGACEYASVCIGCRARALALGGNMLAEDPWCTYQPGAAGPLLADHLEWSPEALERLERIPGFIRGRVKQALEGHARQRGYTTVTPELMAEVRQGMGGHHPWKP